MTRGSHVGDVLRTRREQLGIPLDVAADATNIRARMLATLEAGDFGSYPPHGHATGMLSSYARYLELDPHDVLERFEAEYAAFQSSEEMARSADRTRRGVGRYGEHVSSSDRPITRDSSRARRSTRSTARGADDGDTPTSRLSAKLSDEQVAEGDNRYVSGSVKVVAKRSTDSTRHIEPPRSRQDGSSASTYASHRAGARDGGGAAPSDTARDRSHAGPVAAAGSSSSRQGATSRPRTRGALRENVRTRDEHLDSDQREALSYFGDVSSADATEGDSRPRIRHRSHEARSDAPDDGGGLPSRLAHAMAETFSDPRRRLVALAVIALAIALVIALFVFFTATGNDDAGVISVEGGVEQTETVEQEDGSATATVTTTNGNPITVVISVAEGDTSLVTVTYDDDNDYSGTAVGPWEREFLVTDSLSATFGNPDAVTITENGTQVQVATLEDGTGQFNLEVQNVSADDADDGSQDDDAS